MLEGKLKAKLAKKWALGRDQSGSICTGLVPRREMKEIL
jgi:hypothetical protein